MFCRRELEGSSRTLTLSKTMANSYAKLLLPYLNMSIQSTNPSFPDYRELSASSNCDHNPDSAANYSYTDDSSDADKSFMNDD